MTIDNGLNTRTHGVIDYVHRMILKGITNGATHVIRHTLRNGTERFALIMESDAETEITSGLTEIASFQVCHIDVITKPIIDVDGFTDGEKIVIRLHSDPTDYGSAPCALCAEIEIDSRLSHAPNYARIGDVAKLVADYLNCY
ncbi:hypothetical protein UFOVP453_34 [uncultured Caudovirales phage]|uniref:Uncharacterized protein n=1 Tax=uncultured Caudovirales phage TaxID=2100421 RepID=A0A6J5MDQ3_9CAUD|nr:hypothetical protein UFOVP453_34 [uncultured Caudovirales phage]